MKHLTICTAALLLASIGCGPTLPVSKQPDDQPKAPRSAIPAGVAQKQPRGGKKPTSKDTVPRWIWVSALAKDNQRGFFRRTFNLPARPSRATLTYTCDDNARVWVNGTPVGQSSNWQTPISVNVKRLLHAGKNLIAVAGRNSGGVAAFACRLELRFKGGSRRVLVSNSQWLCADNASKGWNRLDSSPAGWRRSVVIGKMGDQPWGNVMSRARAPVAVVPVPVSKPTINVAPGFRVELVYKIPRDRQGSWVSLTVDDRGRLIASDQYGGLYRITPAKPGQGPEATRVEPIDLEIGAAQGLLYAFDRLYVVVSEDRKKGSKTKPNRIPPSRGLYQVRDTNGDDRFDEVKKLRDLSGRGEHGPHGLVLSPDGKSLFVIAGNATSLPSPERSAPTRTWGEDLLLPRMFDPRGHARGTRAPGGWICRTDPDGKVWEFYAGGYRNSYDLAFNADGELFTYDSDMEWDMGSPWYRPTRVVHVVSGGEYGWRTGSGKWPPYFADSLPATIDIGPGSPTGVLFGTGARFPARYQRALYVLDWTYATIYAVHLTPSGATYTAEKEEFISGKPLPVTDMVVNPKDGAMYFTTGGRRIQSNLYRVTYIGTESTRAVEPERSSSARHKSLRALRRRLELFHGQPQPHAVNTAWSYLSHPDRFVRYAARVAIEHQPVEQWRARALAERVPQASILACIALARHDEPTRRDAILDALRRIDFAALPDNQRLDLLRAYALVFIRMGKPDQQTAARVIDALNPHFPAQDDLVNPELARLLVYLRAPGVIERTLTLMAQPEPSVDWGQEPFLQRSDRYAKAIRKMLRDPPPTRQMHYATLLRTLRYGWTLQQRRAYFTWIDRALEAGGGNSFVGYIKQIKKEALANTSLAEREALASLTGEKAPAPEVSTPKLIRPKGPGRAWKVNDLVALSASANGLRGRNFTNGRDMYRSALCFACHRFDGAGGDTGPDLTGVANRFSVRDIIEAIIEPYREISDQYALVVIKKKDGTTVLGRIVEESADAVTLIVNPLVPDSRIVVAVSDIRSKAVAPVSFMSPGLINGLNQNEALDLLAYLISQGNPEDQVYKK